jgi:CRISPR-associated protein Csb1
MHIQDAKKIISSASAIRIRQKLQPAGGKGDKVFPSTYEGAQYAEEIRLIDGKQVPVVHLDSVQSQANRMELALLKAIKAGRIKLPLVQVDFPAAHHDLVDIGIITSLDAPHRLADAIFRDSLKDGMEFRKTEEGKILDTASIYNATDLYTLCPTALLFGIWDSTGPKGGLGVKFQRSIVSEIVAFDVVKGVKTSSRIDPLGIVLNAGVAYRDLSQPGGWTLEQKDSQGKSLSKVGKEGKPSELNHGNVTPSISTTAGGITFDYALQTTVISLPSLRRLQFPIGSKIDRETNESAHTVLALLGLCAFLLSQEDGYDLRSRCLLVPEDKAAWEILGNDGSIELIDFDSNTACALYNDAVDDAAKHGLRFMEQNLTLQPSEGLAKLVLKSQELSKNS